VSFSTAAKNGCSLCIATYTARVQATAASVGCWSMCETGRESKNRWWKATAIPLLWLPVSVSSQRSAKLKQPPSHWFHLWQEPFIMKRREEKRREEKRREEKRREESEQSVSQEIGERSPRDTDIETTFRCERVKKKGQKFDYRCDWTGLLFSAPLLSHPFSLSERLMWGSRGKGGIWADCLANDWLIRSNHTAPQPDSLIGHNQVKWTSAVFQSSESIIIFQQATQENNHPPIRSGRLNRSYDSISILACMVLF